MLVINMGANKGAAVGAQSKSGSTFSAGPNGSRGLGITTLACGFDNSSGDSSIGDFVLNLRLKAKSNLILSTASPNYETWYPSASCGAGSNNYCKGVIREVRMKFTMRNITTRGAYFWRVESLRNCLENGTAATSSAQCCSQAWNGTACAACLPAGSLSTSASACCAGRLNAAGSACI
jgi:frataxin-like iron-binding protein CyaY